jgi:hypothetical protein
MQNLYSIVADLKNISDPHLYDHIYHYLYHV